MSLSESQRSDMSYWFACGGGGRGGTQQIFVRGGSTPRSNPLPFYRPFLTEKVPFLYIFHYKMVLLSHTYLRALHPFSKPLKGSLLVIFM